LGQLNPSQSLSPRRGHCAKELHGQPTPDGLESPSLGGWAGWLVAGFAISTTVQIIALALPAVLTAAGVALVAPARG
jgi:hypothetical protein